MVRRALDGQEGTRWSGGCYVVIGSLVNGFG